MDKYEYRLKLDQMKMLAGKGDYSTAAEIADSINWRKIKNVNLLIKAGDIYTKTGRYDEARDILLMAYDRSPIGRMIIYRLAEIAVKMQNFEDAEEYYDEFVEIAPHDNLKYVLRYKICKAKRTDYQTQIAILEELKAVEYTEEWTYELAYLYHQAGEASKCIETCDELILWFGDGVYVERALELKMLYQPLTKTQEDKYRSIKQRRDGLQEVYLKDSASQTETEQAGKFDTQNLQEELAKSMQQIMQATEKETVTDTMDNIKKMVEEIPYLQMPSEEELPQTNHIETDEEIDHSLRENFNEMNEAPELTHSHEAMSIEDVLSEWEKTKRAAEAALQMAEQQKLESAKARALQEAGDIMDRLSDVIPKLEEIHSPQLQQEYLSDTSISDEERAGRIVAGMNDMLQQQIDRLQEEAQEDEKEHELLRKVKQAKPNFDEQIGLKPYVPQDFVKQDELQTEVSEETAIPQEESETAEEFIAPQEKAETEEAVMPNEESEAAEEFITPQEEAETDEEVAVQQTEEEFTAPSLNAATEAAEEFMIPQEEIHTAESAFARRDTKELKTEEITDALNKRIEELTESEEEFTFGEQEFEETAFNEITKLSDEQKEIFSYFVPVAGMEQQICQALSGVMKKICSVSGSAYGNLLIQGGKGCGKTVLATGVIKALQKETGRLNGKVGKIDAEALNKKDIAKLLEKVQDGCLIIERAGEIDRETAVKLSLLLERDAGGVFVIMEDTRVGLEQALGRDEGLAKKFTEKIIIPVFTSDELVAFGKAYANDLDYEIDSMGVLALYNRISNIQRLDRATTLTEVKEIVDEAIENAEKKTLKKAFSILTSRRYTEDDYVILREKDFEE